MSQEKNVKEQLKEELDKRITTIDSPDYQYVKRLDGKDYLGMVVVAVICVAIIIYGIV